MADSLTVKSVVFFQGKLPYSRMDRQQQRKNKWKKQNKSERPNRPLFSHSISLPSSVAPSLCCPVSPVFPRSRREDESREVYGVGSLSFAHTHPPSQISPPREERPSALEALRVGLAVGTLRGSSRLHDHRWHLHQLQRSLSILQSLRQVENLLKDPRVTVVSLTSPHGLKSTCHCAFSC